MSGEFPERNIVKLTRLASGAEEEAYRRLVESQFRDDDDEQAQSNKGRLFKITLEKRYFQPDGVCQRSGESSEAS